MPCALKKKPFDQKASFFSLKCDFLFVLIAFFGSVAGDFCEYVLMYLLCVAFD